MRNKSLTLAVLFLISIFLKNTIFFNAHAQDYPSRPITIVVPFPAGTGTDVLVRPVALELQKLLGQPILIENKAGAQGVIGATFVARAKPDGYTLLVGSSTTLAANVGLFKSLPFDPLKDFQPVSGLSKNSMLFLVRGDSSIKNLTAFLQNARTQNAPLTVGYASSSGHVALALLSQVTGIKFQPVPYKGSPQALTDVIGGSISMAAVDVGSGVPQVRSGRLTPLAIMGSRRSVSLPDVPTVSETYPNTSLETWLAIVAPAGTPSQVVNKLYDSIAKVISTREMADKFADLSFDVDLVAPVELGRRMVIDQTKWIELINAAGIQPE